MKNTEKRPKALSLFSGAGGMDIGVLKAGFNVKACMELDKFACETLRAAVEREQRDTKVYEGDVREVDPNELKKELGLKTGELDLLFGGPPCQAFSAIGKQQGLDDPRGMLLFEMARFAEVFEPKVILIEQVKGLLSAATPDGKRGGVYDLLVSDLKRIGYEAKHEVLLAANYGVAQMRQRVFVVAVKGSNTFQYPHPTHGEGDGLFPLQPYVTVGDVIGDLDLPMQKNGHVPEDSHLDVTPDRDRFRMNGVAEGSWLAKELHLPVEQRCNLGKKDTTKYRRMHTKEPGLTLRCGEIFYHPIDNRYLTPREYMRIHGYPDDYLLKGPIRSRTGVAKNLDQHRQVANSVPPPLARALAESIKDQLLCQKYTKSSGTP